MRVLQTLALPLGYVTVLHCPGQRLDGYYNIAPGLCQGANFGFLTVSANDESVHTGTAAARREARPAANEVQNRLPVRAQPGQGARLSSHCANVPPARLLLILPARSAHAKSEFVSSLLFFRSKKGCHPMGGILFWSGRRGSNSLPRPWQGRALPDELRPQMVPPVGVEPTTRGFSVRCSTN